MQKVRKVKRLGKNAISFKETRVNVLCRSWSKTDYFILCRMEYATIYFIKKKMEISDFL